jgi:hypothetical protein
MACRPRVKHEGRSTPRGSVQGLNEKPLSPSCRSLLVRQNLPVADCQGPDYRDNWHHRSNRQKCQIRNDPYIPHILTQPHGFEPPIDRSNRHCRHIRHNFTVRLDRNNR